METQSGDVYADTLDRLLDVIEDAWLHGFVEVVSQERGAFTLRMGGERQGSTQFSYWPFDARIRGVAFGEFYLPYKQAMRMAALVDEITERGDDDEDIEVDE